MRFLFSGIERNSNFDCRLKWHCCKINIDFAVVLTDWMIISTEMYDTATVTNVNK